MWYAALHLLGSWKGQIEKKFQSGIHLDQFRVWRGLTGTFLTRFGLNSLKRPSTGQIGPQNISADLAYGVNLALFILQYSYNCMGCWRTIWKKDTCTCNITILLNLNFNSYQNKQGMRWLQFRNITKQDIENIHCVKFAPSVMTGSDGLE